MGVGPKAMYISAGTLAVSGLVMGVLALDTNNRIQDYDTKRSEGISIHELIDERNTYAGLADTLFIAGGVALTSALIWHWLGGAQ